MGTLGHHCILEVLAVDQADGAVELLSSFAPRTAMCMFL